MFSLSHTEHAQSKHQTAAEDVQRPAGEQKHTDEHCDVIGLLTDPVLMTFSLSQVKVTNILSAIDAAEYLITQNASHVVKQVQDSVTNKTCYIQ